MRGGTKEKGTLLYDGSASPSSATSSEPAQDRGDGQNAGTVPQSATDKANVPFDDDIISQELQTGKIKTPSQCRTPEPKSGTNCKGICQTAAAFQQPHGLSARVCWHWRRFGRRPQTHCCTDIVSANRGKVNERSICRKNRPHKTPCIAFEQVGLIVDTRRKRTPTKTNRSKAQGGREGMGQGTFTGCKALHGKHHGSGSIESKLSKQGYTQKKIFNLGGK